jgi:hypothetical protein
MLFNDLRNKFFFYGEGLLVPRPTSQAGGPPLIVWLSVFSVAVEKLKNYNI